MTLEKETWINLVNTKAVCESIILPPGKTDPVDDCHGGFARIRLKSVILSVFGQHGGEVDD